MPGHTLNITKINRVHMGAYQCMADNGVPPAANATFLLEVHCKYISFNHKKIWFFKHRVLTVNRIQGVHINN